MKFLILPLCLLGVIHAFGQAPDTQAHTFKLRQAAPPTFKALADTVGKPQYVSIPDPVTVVWLATPKWAVINRGKTEAILSTRYLQDFRPDGIPTKAPSPSPAPESRTVGLTGPPVYAIARTTGSNLKRSTRFLELDLGTKTPLSKPFYLGPDGQAMAFETETVVLNFLDAQGWVIIDSRQELITEAAQQNQQGLNKRYEYDNVYILKRK